MPAKQLTIADVTWRIEATQDDDTPIKGNASASGDDVQDRKAERWIEKQLENGNVWAWALVRVIGTYKGLSADTYMGACSYHTEEEFIADGSYFDLQREVLADLQMQLEDIVENCVG